MRKTKTIFLILLAALASTLFFSSACFAGSASDPIDNCCPDGSYPRVNPLQVYVYDKDTNLPLKGAKVVISGPGEVITPSSYNVKYYTNSKGYTGVYSGLIKPGDYYVDVTLKGRDPVRQLVTIVNSEKFCEPMLISIPLEKPCDRSLEVCVWDDTSSTPVPISGASVTINSTTQSYTATKTTLSSGCTLFKPISAGTYLITASANGYLPATPSTITMGISECNKFQIRIGLRKPCVPSMKVCLFDKDNHTAINGTVTIVKSGGTPTSMGTTSGCAKFANLTAGTYTVSASVSDYEVANPVTVTISADDKDYCEKPVTLELKKKPCDTPSIKACIYDQDHPGTAITGFVSIDRDGADPITVGTTGGCATFANLSTGTYTVSAVAAGFNTTEPKSVTLVQGDCEKQLTFYLKRKTCEEDRSLQIYVHNEDGNPINGAKVVITNGGYSVNAVTDATGFTPVIKGAFADGTYTVTVIATGYNPGTAQAVFQSDICGKLNLKVELKCNCLYQGSIQVKVRNKATGYYIPKAKVRITGPGGYSVTDYTNSKGVTDLLGASSLGTYGVEVTKTGYIKSTSTFDISSYSLDTLVITVYLEKL